MTGPTFENTQFKNHCDHMVEREWKVCPICGAEVKAPETDIDKLKRLKEELKKAKEENERLKHELENLEES